MKILAIRIKNLASLEGVTEIDFTSEPLSSLAYLPLRELLALENLRY
ncbi:hypothetical protein [Sphingobacterium sp. B29]|nr:hypothetical protein [Sphingobacterium sp. B29]